MKWVKGLTEIPLTHEKEQGQGTVPDSGQLMLLAK